MRRKQVLTAALVVVGDELLDGRRDTNGPTVEAALTAWGLEPQARLVLPDRLDLVARGVAGLLQQHDVVITCGGLGPTQDDVTRQACARALRVPLEFKPAAWHAILSRFRRFGWSCTPNNRIQAMVPRGAQVLANPHGTAPGFFYKRGWKILAALPGPPRELLPMLAKQLGPRLHFLTAGASGSRLRRSFRVAGVGESQLQAWLGPLAEKPGWPELGFLLDEPGEILVILTVRNAAATQARVSLARARQEIKALLGVSFVGDAQTTLPAAVGKILRQRQQTLAVAESCTGGLVSRRLTAVPGASKYFLESVVAYSNAAKISRLQVAAALIARHGAVSETVALAMARGIKRTSGADWGLATTGIAGPGGGTRQKPTGTICLAVAGPRGKSWVSTRRFPGDRDYVQRRGATVILDELRRCLIQHF